MSKKKAKATDQCQILLDHINKTFKRRLRVVDKAKLATRLKTFHMDEILQAVTNASKDAHHIRTNFKYCTFEFFTRNDKIVDRFLNMPVDLEDRTKEEMQQDRWLEKHEGERVAPRVSIKQCNKDQILYLLVKVCKVISIYPTAKEMDFLCKFIANRYKKLQAQDIPRAFELNSVGNHWITIRPFGKLTTLFIGDVLKEYKAAKAKVENKRKKQRRRA